MVLYLKTTRIPDDVIGTSSRVAIPDLICRMGVFPGCLDTGLNSAFLSSEGFFFLTRMRDFGGDNGFSHPSGPGIGFEGKDGSDRCGFSAYVLLLCASALSLILSQFR